MIIDSSILRKIEDKLQQKERVLLAIDGKSGAGKSTLAKELGKVFDANIYHMDDFFLPLELRTEERMKEVGGNVDYLRFKREVMNKLILGEDFTYQVFDCKPMALTEYVSVEATRLSIVEGCYSMHPSLIENYDLKIFLDLEEEKQRERILKRNGPLMYKKFVEEWIPMENSYFDDLDIRGKSDLYFKY